MSTSTRRSRREAGSTPSRPRRLLHSTAIAALATGFLLLGQLTGLPSGSAASPPGTVVFVAAGDFGSSSAAGGVLTGMAVGEPELALALGDLSYGSVGGEGAWCDFVTSRFGAGRPFELVAGNHDNGSNGNINDFSACLPNQLPGLVGTYGREYYVDYPQSSPLVRFIMISPNLAFNGAAAWNYAAGSTRYNWTASAIDQARSRSIPWVVVGMHYPCLSVGVYGCAAGEDITNLLVSKRVDLVLNGHEHMYQRTKQLALGASCSRVAAGSYAAGCVADADAALTRGAGTVFVTSGLGGREQRTVNNSDPEAGYFAAASGSNASPSYGFLRVTATLTQLQAAFVATSGSFTDTFTIAPGAPDTTPPTAPADLRATVAGTSVDLAWSASSDDVGVTGYQVYRGTTPGFAADATSRIGQAAGLSYTDSSLAAGSYYYRVIAVDAAGNASPASDAVAATVAPPDPQPTVVRVTTTVDAGVRSGDAANYGNDLQLWSRRSPSQESFLQFALPVAPAGKTLQAAALEMSTSGDASAGSTGVHRTDLVSGTWTESGVNWNNRPTTVQATLGTFTAPTTTYTRFEAALSVADLNSMLGSTVTIRLSSDASDDNLRTGSAEAATALRPRLRLSFGSG